jgi:hypothetical protein
MLKYVMISECVSCVPCVLLHASVVYVACGIEILDVLDIKIHVVATLVRESTYLRSSHGSRRRSASRYLPRTRVQDTHY